MDEILIVEDSRTQAEELRHILEGEGYRVTIAASGKEALESLARRLPAAVISDIVMPEMDGFTLCHRIREGESYRTVPVILLTALSDTNDILRSLECGADFFITKPMDAQSLKSRLKSLQLNRNLHSQEPSQTGIEVFFGAQKHRVNANRVQILNLLLSTYEGAIQVNRRLAATQQELEGLALELENKVRERTAELTVEIDERKRVEEALRRSEEKYRYLVENSNEIIHTVDGRGIITFVNPAAERLSGYRAAEVVGRSFKRFLFADDHTAVMENHRKILLGRSEPLECRMLTKSGETRWVRFQNHPIMRGPQVLGVQGAMMDITEHRSLEERFLQAQKMEAMGRLAGGVAHDFNNMLMVIQGFSDITAKSLPADDKRQMYVGEIRKASERAASLTQQLLTFSRKQVPQSEVLSLGTVVADAEAMLKRLIGEDIQLVVSTDPSTPDVRADRGHLVQVLMNLAVNARDAMPKGGTLAIRTSLKIIDEASPTQPDVEQGEYAVLTVSDSGTGIPPEVRAHLFEPFFTTKEKGKGTGLGLATVYGIVKQSGGHIWCLSREGKGTTFSIYLPRTREAGKTPTIAEAAPEDYRGSETVLLVEDEDSVREIVRTVLVQNGYTVLECRNGAEAIETFARNPEGVALLITDMVLPGMSGMEIAEAISRKRPGIGIIVMSGYGDGEAGMLDGLSAPGLFIQKPFRSETLLRNVRIVLRRRK